MGGGLRTLAIAGRDVLDGYDAGAMAASGRGQVLIPWPNRLDHGRYDWDGQSQQVPINEIERSNAIHGLVRFAGWNCVEATADRVDMAHTLWPSPGYPFTLQIQIAYQVDDVGLTVTTTTRNVGTTRGAVRCRSASLHRSARGRQRRRLRALGAGPAVSRDR